MKGKGNARTGGTYAIFVHAKLEIKLFDNYVVMLFLNNISSKSYVIL